MCDGNEREVPYTNCGQCLRHCPVTELRCDNGKKYYREVTGKEYSEAAEAVPVQERGKESAFRRNIRKRRGQ